MLSKALGKQDQLFAWRRDFHQYPELGYHEFRTAQAITDILGDFGYRVQCGIGKTGVLAELG